MDIGIYDVDSTRPNLPLMKISAWHKSKGDNVEFLMNLKHYDKVYVSKEFGDEYSTLNNSLIMADKIVYGGTGFAINVEGGVETYYKQDDWFLPNEIEHIYPDYELYNCDHAIGFLTRGCPNNCDYCIVSKKEGRVSHKVADLNEFWKDQKRIDIMDSNILACKDRIELLEQLARSQSKVDFIQGLDARFVNEEVCDALNDVRVRIYHFAFDLMDNKDRVVKGLEMATSRLNLNKDKCNVFILTNYNTTFEEDMERIRIVRELGLSPYVMIYRKNAAPQLNKWLQRYTNNKFVLYSTPDFMDYKPLKNGKTIKDYLGEGYGY